MTPASHRTTHSHRSFLRSFVATACAVAFLSLAVAPLAQDAAAQTLSVMRWIVPFAAGSYTDNIARIIAPGVSERLGQTIVIDNRAGANGIIGADFVAKAAPDGHTLLVGGASVNVVNPNVYKSLPYDPVRDLLPVARIGLLPFMLVVNNEVPAANVAELVAYAKKNPGKLSYGTPNAATLVGMETFKRSAGINIVSVPYKSSPQAIGDLVGNHVQVAIADFGIAMPQVKAGKARVLAVTMPRRSALLPEVPPLADTIPNFDVSAWTGLFMPGKTPPALATRVFEAMRATLATPEVRDKLLSIGFDVQPLGPEDFGNYVRSEIKTWATLVKDAGIQPE
ncbi:MAG: tripartite tricarboxylate transporter substrate binding protein [Casimicrobiaceae bacterium]